MTDPHPNPYAPSGDSRPDSWPAPDGRGRGAVPSTTPTAPYVWSEAAATGQPAPYASAPAAPGYAPAAPGYAPPPGYGPAVGAPGPAPHPAYPTAYPTAYGPGYPAYGYAGAGYAPSRNNGLATASLVVGIVSLTIGILISIGLLGVVGGVVGIGLGIGGLRRATRDKAPGRGVAIGGIAVSAVAALAGGAIFGVYVASDDGESFFDDTSDTGSGDTAGTGGSTSADYDRGWNDGWDEGYDAGADASSEPRPAPGADDWMVGGVPEGPMGSAATVGTYAVTVTAVSLDADDALLAASDYNAAAEGRYVLVTMSVTNTGPTATRPYMELMASVWGTDDLLYDEMTCEAFTPRPSIEAGVLQPGESAEVDVCMDVPEDALGATPADVSVVVEGSGSDDVSAYRWTLS